MARTALARRPVAAPRRSASSGKIQKLEARVSSMRKNFSAQKVRERTEGTMITVAGAASYAGLKRAGKLPPAPMNLNAGLFYGALLVLGASASSGKTADRIRRFGDGVLSIGLAESIESGSPRVGAVDDDEYDD